MQRYGNGNKEKPKQRNAQEIKKENKKKEQKREKPNWLSKRGKP
jgi:hypothetical protein